MSVPVSRPVEKIASLSGAGGASVLASYLPAAAGARVGAGVGASVARKKRLKAAILGATIGLGVGGVGGQVNLYAQGRRPSLRQAQLAHAVMYSSRPHDRFDVRLSPLKTALLMHGVLPKGVHGVYRTSRKDGPNKDGSPVWVPPPSD